MGNTQSPSLPQHDKQIQSRKQKLDTARENYQLEQKTFGLTNIEQREVNIVNIPPMLSKLPKEEQWSFSSLMKFAFRYLFYFLYQRVFQCCHCGGWTIRQIIKHFTSSCVLEEPKGCEVWRTEFVNRPNQTATQKAQTDHWFAWQRLNGVTRNLIKLATEIPQQFGPFVKAIENDHPYLGGKSLMSHIQDKTLFVVDLADVSFNEPTLLAPIALFVIYNNLLMPVAIRIDPRKPDNKEVFKPPQLDSDSMDNLRNWVKGRMWFNMLDAQYHESVTHLGFTHLLMDGVSVCMHRNLSERHPIYKLMLPHFRYMHFINDLATKELIQPGGYVDRDMYFGQRNMMKLIAKHNERWSFDEHGSIEKNFRVRGVMDIPGYFFRDDALQLLDAIQKFVHEYVAHYYQEDQEVINDQEIQAFRAELVAPRSLTDVGGCGMLDVPEFDSIANVVTVLANVIFICSVEHSATNFPQYEQYAFPPNMPAILSGQPELENGVHELDEAMPTGQKIFSTIKIMMVLTTITTNSLGNYEAVYVRAMDNAGRRIVQKFQQNLIAVRDKINQRNNSIENSVHQINGYPYEWLLPANVRNSISV